MVNVLIVQRRTDISVNDSTFALASELKKSGNNVQIATIDNNFFEIRNLTDFYSSNMYEDFFKNEILSEIPESGICLIRIDPPITDDELYFIAICLSNWKFINLPFGISLAQKKTLLAKLPYSRDTCRLVRSKSEIEQCLELWGTVVVKPIVGFGGKGITKIDKSDLLDNKLLKLFSFEGNKDYLVMKFFPEIYDGEVRAFFVSGVPLAALRKTPTNGEWRVNAQFQPNLSYDNLSNQEIEQLTVIGRILCSQGLQFFALDFVRTSDGPKIIEINVCNPGGIIQLENISKIPVVSKIVSALLNPLIFKVGA